MEAVLFLFVILSFCFEQFSLWYKHPEINIKNTYHKAYNFTVLGTNRYIYSQAMDMLLFKALNHKYLKC